MAKEIIQSFKNPLFKKLLSLTKSRGILRHGLALVSGGKLTDEISKLDPLNPFWIMTEKMSLPPKTQGDHRRRTVYLSKELFDCLDVCGTHSPLICCQYGRPKPLSSLNSKRATVYVGMGEPGNLGALVRSCTAFYWPQIVLLAESAHPFLPRVIRASSGAVFKASFFTGPSISELTDPQIVALDPGGKPFQKKDMVKNLKLLVGEEGQGVPLNFKGPRWSIPISKKTESLNVTVAVSLLMYEWSQNHQKRISASVSRLK